jgi:hypothetical protein
MTGPNDVVTQRILEQKFEWQGFSEEWITVGKNRVHISVRDGFPIDSHRKFAAEIAALLEHPGCERARLVAIFDDDTHGCLTGFVVTDKPEEEAVINERLSLWCELWEYEWSMSDIQIEVVPPSKRQDSDHYNHMAYLRDATCYPFK